MAKTRPNYGISRIDQPDKKNHGFYVRITHKGKLYQKYFPDKASGGKNKALFAAKVYRDEVVAKLPKYKQEAVAKKRRKIRKSDVVGVTHVVAKSPSGDRIYHYWQAAWDDARGVRRTAKFSINRYGEKEALEMATNARSVKGRSAVKKASKKKVARKQASKKRTARKAAPKQAAKKQGGKKPGARKKVKK